MYRIKNLNYTSPAYFTKEMAIVNAKGTSWVEEVDENAPDFVPPTLTEEQEMILLPILARTAGREVRCCSCCGAPLKKGWYLNGEYACCDECAAELYDEKELEAHINDDSGHFFLTEWEDFFLDS